MIDYGRICAPTRPQLMEIKASSVFIASDIEEYEVDLEGHITTGFRYNLKQYPKDEYIAVLEEKNKKLESDLLDTQAALCDIYELLAAGGIE